MVAFFFFGMGNENQALEFCMLFEQVAKLLKHPDPTIVKSSRNLRVGDEMRAVMMVNIKDHSCPQCQCDLPIFFSAFFSRFLPRRDGPPSRTAGEVGGDWRCGAGGGGPFYTVPSATHDNPFFFFRRRGGRERYFSLPRTHKQVNPFPKPGGGGSEGGG